MENLSRSIGAKFDLAARLAERAPPPGGGPLCAELEALRARYTLSTSHLFFEAGLGEGRRLAARDEFLRIVAAGSFVEDLQTLVAAARLALGVPPRPPAPGGPAPAPPRGGARVAPAGGGRRERPAPARARAEVQAILDQFDGHEVDCAAGSLAAAGSRFDFCPECCVEMDVAPETSELSCPGCGAVRELVGTVFDDAQFYNQEGQKAKSGSFNPNRHFHFWMDRILAREPEEELGDRGDPDNSCGEKVLESLERLRLRDNKILRLLTVDDIRGFLKEICRTDLNKNVPLILRRLTGVGPPDLSESICQKVEKLFTQAIQIGERVRGSGNRNYYPYYIYKILDSILPEDDFENRRALYYIYMQGQDTLDKNDQEWLVICDALDEIEWVATNRGKAWKYRPT